jgi:FdrA protein
MDFMKGSCGFKERKLNMKYTVIKPNAYYDSVTLMLFSSKLNGVDGVIEAAVMMGTNHNKELMLNSGLLTKEESTSITSNDLVIGIKAKDQTSLDIAVKVLNDQFEAKSKVSQQEQNVRVKSVEQAVETIDDLNFAVVSVPGRFAKSEVLKCLNNDLHVLLFSDNVSIEDEIELKNLAVEKGLLMMGPDCGTAIINGVALGFANVVRRGNIGLTAASGTGLQEVSVIIDHLGGGISQALGTGGRDLKASIGGKMMLLTLEALAADPETEVIGIISKPPAAEVMKKVLEKIETIEKPVVVCFLGGEASLLTNSKAYGAHTLEEAAQLLVKLSLKQKPKGDVVLPLNTQLITKTKSGIKGRYVRGLYTGGTLAYEALLILHKKLGGLYSNIATDKKYVLENPETSKENTILDMGEDYFTDGKPHPMIDPSLRTERIVKEALDNQTGVILLDCVIGYGSHENPSESIIKAVQKVKQFRQDLVFVASVTGTEKDPQIKSKQVTALTQAGVIVFETNAQASRFVAEIL